MNTELIKVILSFVDVVISLKFMSNMQAGILKKKFWAVMVIALGLINTAANIVLDSTSGYIIFILIFYVTISVSIFKGKICYKIFIGLLIVVMGIITESVVEFSISIFNGVNIEEIQNEHIYYLVGAFLSKIMLIPVFNSIIRLKKAKWENLSLKYWIMLAFISIGSAVVAKLMAIDDINSTNGKAFNIFISLLILLIINLIAFILFDEIIRKNELEKRNIISKNLIKMQTRRHLQFIEDNKSIRSIWHDMNNHFITLHHYTEKKEIHELENYLCKIIKKVKEHKNIINSGNLAIDSILENKRNTAIENLIDFEFSVKVPESLKIDPIDICGILGNALDNAIEACMKIDKDEINKYIKLKIVFDKGYLFISVLNTFQTIPTQKNGRLLSNKSDSEYHGFGVGNIEKYVDKYNGNLETNFNDKQFFLNIALNLE